MTSRLVSLAHLQDIARRSGTQYAIDTVRRIAYMRRAQVLYYAPADEDAT